MVFCRVPGALCPLLLLAQAGAPPAFEVASVKRVVKRTAPNPAGGRTGFGPSSIDPAQIRYSDATLKALLMQAYNLRAYQISGPAWLDSEYYDIVAKMPDGATLKQVPAMLRSLLAESFGIRVHWETKGQRAYLLTVGRNGPRLAASKESAVPEAPVTGGPSTAARLSFSPDGHVQVIGATMAAFANTLSNFLGRPVLDKTGIPGAFDISLDISLDDISALRSADVEPDQAGAPSIFSALRELGLKLEAKRVPVQHLVVDEAEKIPADN
jgi:uncharacterized protein (TIGR03435 family)